LAGGGTVDRLDRKAVLGEEQRVAADAAAEVDHTLHAARLEHWNQLRDCRVRHQPVVATFRRCPALVPRVDCRGRHLHLPAPLSAVLCRDHKREEPMREGKSFAGGNSASSPCDRSRCFWSVPEGASYGVVRKVR